MTKQKAETIRKFTLKNGLNVLLLKDESLPYIEVDLILDMGHSKDPKDKEGLSDLTLEMLSRGTQTKTEFELSKALDNIAADFGFRTSVDYSHLSAGTLPPHQNQLLKLLGEIASSPAFSESEIQKIKKQNQSMIKNRPDRASYFAHHIMMNSFFKRPLGGSLQSLENIQSQDIREHYEKYFAPQGAILAVSGQYSADIKKQLAKSFSNWKKREKIPEGPAAESPLPLKEPQFLIVHKKGLVQSEIRIFKPAFEMGSPDFLHGKLAGSILGGNMSSRLSSEIREKRGLTYGIHSGFSNYKNLGLLYSLSHTRLQATKQVIDRTMDVMEAFFKEGISEEELKKAGKEYKVNLLSVTGKAEDRLYRRARLKFYELPYDLPQIDRQLKKTKVKHINQVIKKYFNPLQMMIVIYTDFDKIKKDFKDVENIEVKKFSDFL